jgi:NADH-quinone oxidoreductase subunit G
MPIAALSDLQRVLLVGSFLRKDHPLFAQRLRQAALKGARIHSVHGVADDWLMPIASSMVVRPGLWPNALAEIAAAVAQAQGLAAPVQVVPSDAARAIAASLMSGERKAILLGNSAVQHPQAHNLAALAHWIGLHTGAAVGDLTDAANTVGAQLVEAMPVEGGRDASAMLDGTLKACLLLHVEPDRDTADPARAVAALKRAELVVALTSFADAALDCADVLLPVAPFTETSGTFVNAEGRAQSFHGVVKPLGETRPAWKVLRVLGNLLALKGFDFETSEDVRAEALGDQTAISGRLDNRAGPVVPLMIQEAALERLSDVPIYETDPWVRRADGLQHTADARPRGADLPTGLWRQLGLKDGDFVRVTQGEATAELPARLDDRLADGTVRIPSGTALTRTLGAMFGPLNLSKV